MSSSFSSTSYSALLMAFNFFSSVAIINVNKLVFDTHHFKFSTLLTVLHFIVTFVGLWICAKFFKMFKIKVVPIRQVLPLALAFIGFVVFNNLSLQYNSMGFYQLMKVLTTPAIVLIQYVMYSVKIDYRLALTLVPVCVGVAMASASDVQANYWGTVHAVLGIISTSFYQIWVKTRQQDLQLDSWQLLYLQAPVSAVFVFIISLITEPVYSSTTQVGWAHYDYSVPSVIAIFASALLALLVNLSIFMVIGKTSPIAYNVLGHFKLCVILASGFVFFNEQANVTKVMGTVLTVIGVIAYTHLQQSLKSGWEAREKQAQQQQLEQQQQQTASDKSVQLTSVKVATAVKKGQTAEDGQDLKPLLDKQAP